MRIPTLTSREFSQETIRAKKAARSLVVNTDRGNLTCSRPSSIMGG
jgi:hypothetical protein